MEGKCLNVLQKVSQSVLAKHANLYIFLLFLTSPVLPWKPGTYERTLPFLSSVSVPYQALCAFSFIMFAFQLTLCPDPWLMFTDWNSEVERSKDLWPFLIKIKVNVLLIQQTMFQ